ncbi:MAG TPA: MmgE/PrpD family protein [Ramlibacter sp.]|nr:MmgE/PrpD family protein [Ramlibacter sp.]
MTRPVQGAIDALAEFAATASAGGRVPRLALHAADAVTARLAGGATAEGRALQCLLQRIDPGLLGQVTADAAVMRLTEIDDIHRPTAVTVSALTLPVALAFATGDTPPERWFDALHVGQELALRLALAAGGARLLARGQWPSLIAAPLGAAAAAGRLLGLPPERMRHALALAIAQVTRSAGRPLGARTGRWLLFGAAVRSGCVAALAAADGVAGDPGLLDAAWLQAVGGDLADAARLFPTEPLGEALSIKPHASAKQALAAVHGLRQLIDQHGIAPDHIEAIELHVPPAYASMLDREPPQASRLASLVSAPWQLALAAYRPELLDDVARERFPDDSRLTAFAGRVKVHADHALNALYPAAFPARLVLRVNGNTHELLVTDSPGDPALPYDAPQLLAKARRMLGDGPGLAIVQAALRLPTDSTALRTLRAAFDHA